MSLKLKISVYDTEAYLEFEKIMQIYQKLGLISVGLDFLCSLSVLIVAAETVNANLVG